MSRPGRPEAVAYVVASVGFGFYSDGEVRAISAKRVTSAVMFDHLLRPAPDGLYDPAMGPLDHHATCATCRQSYVHCPGHFGHIELALPVYNPLVFPVLLKLLRATCLACHRFKMPKPQRDPACCGVNTLECRCAQVERYAQMLELIARGQLDEASMVVASKAKGAGAPGDDSGDGQDEDDEDEAGTAAASEEVSGQRSEAFAVMQPATTHSVAAAKGVVREFLAGMPRTVCGNCRASNPLVRKEGATKLFQMPLTAKGLESNELNKIVRAHLDLLWRNELNICSLIWTSHSGPAPQASGQPVNGDGRASSPAAFFLQALLVPPNRFRPVNKVNDSVLEHPQNVYFGKILQMNMVLTEIGRGEFKGYSGGDKLLEPKAEGEILVAPKPEEGVEDPVPVLSPAASKQLDSASLVQFIATWLNLQSTVNSLIDSSLSKNRDDTPGIKQHLEKKEGLFCMNMMGKRVNHACRSVISPDPYIQVNEIGIPPYFATRLTYPELVTPWNAEELRALVARGASEHPGATHVEDEKGNVVALQGMPQHKRLAIAKTLLSTPSARSGELVGASAGNNHLLRHSGKAVYRHLRDGDVLLVNRQPTLHKPGVMAHKAKVLKGEKTLRLHYANCNTYNADFDGDEMNVHFPQDAGRAEAAGIDHIVSATLLTMRGTLLDQAQYQQLLYAACIPSPTSSTLSDTAASVEIIYEGLMVPMPPAILKPQALWTGKQVELHMRAFHEHVMSTILKHLTGGMPPLSMSAKAKVAEQYWGSDCAEDTLVIIKDSELLIGALDKAQFGKFGLVHAFQELYGSTAAGRLLSTLSRLLTAFLQMHGFTCGVDDLMLKASAETERSAILESRTALVTSSTQRSWASLQKVIPSFYALCYFRDANSSKLKAALARQLRTRKEVARAQLDNRMTSALGRITSAATGMALPFGQLKPFPFNCMSLMTVTGAKGSTVNANQISALLGQQELEGKRVPRMVSGKTLPCFAPWDPSARAGGYIVDRFLTGLRPQEYFFHCMAGRDGLVDTTVKTSRSGYLQRCLVKNLESLKVNYDYTVRDCDSSVVQFRYGGDALDATKISYLTHFDFLLQNQALLDEQVGRKEVLQQGLDTSTRDLFEARALGDASAQPDEKQQSTTSDKVGREGAGAAAPGKAEQNGISHDIIGGQSRVLDECSPGACIGAVSSAFDGALKSFLAKQRKEKGSALRKPSTRRKFVTAMDLKYMLSLAAPGEPVGVLAAQSVGEPSTQMTLNTFHFAGRGEANVTLGIPRLREILMTAAKEIATPIMEVPLLPGKTREDGEKIAAGLRRLTIAEVMRRIEVREESQIAEMHLGGSNERSFFVRIYFHPLKHYPLELALSWQELEKAFEKQFIPRVQLAMRRAQARAQHGGSFIVVPAARSKGAATDREGGGDEEEGGDSLRKTRKAEGAANECADDEVDDEGGEDEGANAEKYRMQEKDDQEYDDADDEEERAIAAEAGGGAAGGEWVEDAAEDEVLDVEGQDPSKEVLAGQGGEGKAIAEVDSGQESEEDDSDQDLLDASSGGATAKRRKEGGEPGVASGGGREQENTKSLRKAQNKVLGAGRKRQAAASFDSTYLSNQEEGWCEVAFGTRLDTAAPMLHEVVENVAASVAVRATRGIERAAVLDALDADMPPRLQIEGLNFEGVWEFADFVDVNKLRTNHIAQVLGTYGVEAARATIVAETQKVFGMYGINVAGRHLELIADYMTFGGGFRACSRIGIESSPSPFLKMSFETAMHFLLDATLTGQTDHLESPSARIIVGRVADVGTGSFSLLQHYPEVKA
eukprot:SM000113S24098  [mRNA]  locus=s113:326320:337241:- [translate_table: standard]